MNCRLLVVSAPQRIPILAIWLRCRAANWPDCPLIVDFIAPDEQNDIGWNANLLRYLETIDEPFVVLMLDDHFIAKAPEGQYTRDITNLLQLMETQLDIGMVKLQAGNAHPPELMFHVEDRLREYDRQHHPFKRTNLVPTLFRRTWLQRLASEVLKASGPEKDVGRLGALEFEVMGTLLTEDAEKWPERMLGIHRPNPDGGGGRSILASISNDGVREGRLQAGVVAELSHIMDVRDIPGIGAFL